MELLMLGTGHAMVTRCYNTCFLLSGNGERLLVDAGGGNGILVQLEKAGVSVDEIHTIYVTHKHVDHVMGVIWMIRTICQNINRGTYRGTLTVCAHQELLDIIRSIVMMLIREKETRHIGSRVLFVPVADGEESALRRELAPYMDLCPWPTGRRGKSSGIRPFSSTCAPSRRSSSVFPCTFPAENLPASATSP